MTAASIASTPCRYCWLCIIEWAKTENKCPFCKARFAQISRKQLQEGQEGELQQLRGKVQGGASPGAARHPAPAPQPPQVSCRRCRRRRRRSWRSSWWRRGRRRGSRTSPPLPSWRGSTARSAARGTTTTT
jgi:hypothetical protein